MRIYYFVLVACTATLAGSTNASEPSSRSMTNAENEAAIRSAHDVQDGVAVKKPLVVHDHKTGEERTAPAVKDVEAIEKATSKLLKVLRGKATNKRPTVHEQVSLMTQQNAIKHHVKKHFMLVAALRKLQYEQLEATALTKAMSEASRADVHPSEFLKKMIPEYEDDYLPGKLAAAMVYGKLEKYIMIYNAARPDTPPVRMFATLYHGFGDLAKLASFLSILKLNFEHAQDAERLEQLLYMYLIEHNTQFDEVALKLAIPTQGQSILGHHNLAFFIRCISTVMDVLPSEHQEISTLLTIMFGKEQAVSVIEKAEKMSSSVSSDSILKRLEPLRLKLIQAWMLKTLKDEIAVVRTQLG
ncbi:unnamed protein product [Hyaloperonospora brassicae]|uniref:RxLR effector protein n=1 Tax=Hyaloperonospora brassicae TaxID=162125 RepID=A0AAV0UGJ8_HYABA|nr:unnamed protein product [Hyaloperonospora brassicae]